MTQLITVARAKEAFPSSYDGSDDSVLGDILSGVTAFLNSYTNRTLTATSFDELYHGTGERLLYLNNYPILSVERVATIPAIALYYKFTNVDLGYRAVVSSDATGVTMTSIGGGVTTTNTFLYTTYPTLTAMATACNAITDWEVKVQNGLGSRSSSDLAPANNAGQGSYNARYGCWLRVMYYDLIYHVQDMANGQLYSPEGFTRGFNNFRVTYTAGYVTCPDDLAQACAELTYATYMARRQNPNFSSENEGGYGYSALAEKGFDGLSAVAKKTIHMYRRIPVAKFSEW